MSLNLNLPFEGVGIETTISKHITDVTAAEAEMTHLIQPQLIVPPTRIIKYTIAR